MTTRSRNGVRKIAAVAAVITIYWFARIPQPSAEERATLAGRFKFTRAPLPRLSTGGEKSIRQVHRDYRPFDAWISSVGAAVAVNDLDADGIENDIVYVDPRRDQVIVSPAPGTGDRYAAFDLRPLRLSYDARTMAPMGAVPMDMNEDGIQDVLVYYWGRTPVAFLHVDTVTPGPPRREDFAECEVAPDPSKIWNSNAAAFADIDGDGHTDLVIGNYFPDGGRLLDVESQEPQTMHDSMSRAFNGGTNRILRWIGATGGTEPAVRYADDSSVLEADVAHGWALGVGLADLDGDALPELYFAHDFGPDRLLHNRSTPGHIAFARLDGVKTLRTPNSKVLGRDSYKGMSVDFGDLNGDGLLDIYVSNIAEEYALEESHFAFVSTGETSAMLAGVAPYRDDSEPLGLSRSGWGWDTRLADFDNDGVLEAIQATGFLKGGADRWPDLHELAMANDYFVHRTTAWSSFSAGSDLSGHEHNPFFVRAADGRFCDIAEEIGLGDPYVTRGMAVADVDADGDLDFFIANQWEDSYEFRNDGANGDGFLSLSIRRRVETKVRDNSRAEQVARRTRPAIGAFVTLKRTDGRGSQVSFVDGGNGHSGKRGNEVHFGLGEIGRDARFTVEVKWRENGAMRTQAFEVSPGRHTLVLGEPGKGEGQ